MAPDLRWPTVKVEGVPDEDPHGWRAVRVFVSSTFNDMHAERDLLVKRVFPRMRAFCEKRRLWLVEVDLRWGVTEEEATTNRNAVGVCLRGVDRSQIFLGLLGQRYGWQPGDDDLAEAMREFSALAGVAEARLSVTEMEIRRALGVLSDNPMPAKVHLFYRRDASYLTQFPADAPPLLGQIYRDADADDDDGSSTMRQKREGMEESLGSIIVNYEAEWMPAATTPELRFPLRAPSSESRSVDGWQRAWRLHAGLAVEGSEIPADSALAHAALAWNARLARGRLGRFRVGAQGLADRIVADLEEAVARAFPKRQANQDTSPLSLELEQQEAFLMTAIEGFVERPRDLARLDGYRDDPGGRPLFLAAPSGSGKTTLLAKWIDTLRNAPAPPPVLFRFIGASDRSTRVEDLLRSLLAEAQRRFGSAAPIPETDRELRLAWRERLTAALGGRPALVVLDGLDQLDSGLEDLTWLPTTLPPQLALVATFRLEGQQALDLHRRLADGARAALPDCEPFTDQDKQLLIDRFLDRYLKRLDDRHVQSVLGFHGARLPSAPLFLKVVLSEIRLFGSFQNLEDEIQRSDGTPESAFGRLIARLSDDQAFSGIPPSVVLAEILPALALARNGLSAAELAELLLDAHHAHDTPVSMEDALDAVHLATCQLRDALATRAGRFSVFYSSLRAAILARFAFDTTGEHSIRAWHQRLAQLFERQRRVPKGETRWLSELPYHLAAAAEGSALVSLLSDLSFIEAKYAAGLGPELLADYERIDDSLVLPENDRARWQDFRRFVRAQHTVLLAEPALTRQQALNEPDASAAHAAAKTLAPTLPTSVFVWVNKPQAPLPVTLRLAPSQGSDVLCRDVCATPQLMLEGTDGGRLLLTDVRTGRIVVDQQLGEPLSACALSPGGTRAATVGGYRHVRLHEVNPWRLIAEARTPAPAERLSANRGFDCLAVTTGWEIHLWRPGHALTRLVATRAHINDCAFSPDGTTLATVGSDGRVCLWEAFDGRLRWYSDRHAIDAQSCVFSRSGRFLVTGSQRHGALWDVRDERFVRAFDAHLGGISALAVADEGEDGARGFAVVTAGDDGAIECHRWSNPDEPPSRWRLDLESGPLRDLWLSPAGDEAVVDTETGPALVTDLQVARASATRDAETREEILSVAITSEGIVAGDADGFVSYFDARGIRSRRCRAHHDHVTSVTPLADGGVVSGGSDGRIAVLDGEGGEPRRHHFHERGLLCATPSPDGQHLAVGDDGGEVGIIALSGAAPREVVRFATTDRSSVLALRWLLTEELLGLATATSIETWDVRGGSLGKAFPHEVGTPVAFLRLTATATMALIGRDGRVAFWNGLDPRPMLGRRVIPLPQITAAAFLSARERVELVTVHTTGEVALWQWPDLTRLGLHPTGQRLQALATRPWDRRVVVAGTGGRPLVFDLGGG